MPLPLLACFAGVPLLLIGVVLRFGKNPRIGVLLGIAALSLLGASVLFLTGNRQHEMAGIPYIVMGGLVFWGIFAPSLAAAFYFDRRKGRMDR